LRELWCVDTQKERLHGGKLGFCQCFNGFENSVHSNLSEKQLAVDTMKSTGFEKAVLKNTSIERWLQNF